MEREAARLGPAFSWSSVADQYARLGDQILADQALAPDRILTRSQALPFDFPPPSFATWNA